MIFSKEDTQPAIEKRKEKKNSVWAIFVFIQGEFWN